MFTICIILLVSLLSAQTVQSLEDIEALHTSSVSENHFDTRKNSIQSPAEPEQGISHSWISTGLEGGYTHDLERDLSYPFHSGFVRYTIPVRQMNAANHLENTRYLLDTLLLNYAQSQAQEEHLFAVQEAYISYWNNRRKRLLAERALEEKKEVDSILSDREMSGLLLVADKVELLQLFTALERDRTEFARREDQALAELEYLCRRPISPFTPLQPPVVDVMNKTRYTSHMVGAREDSLLAVLKSLFNEENRKSSAYSAYTGVSLRYTGRPEYKFGGDGRIFFNLDIPFGDRKIRENRNETETSAIRAAIENTEEKKRRIIRDFARQYIYYTSRKNTLASRKKSLEKRLRALRGTYLRSGFSDGDMITVFIQTRHRYYHSMLEFFDAEAEYLLSSYNVAHIAGNLSDHSRSSYPNMSYEAENSPQPELVNLKLTPMIQHNLSIEEMESRFEEKISLPDTVQTQGRSSTSGKHSLFVWSRNDFELPELSNDIQTLAVAFSAEEVTQLKSDPRKRQDLHRYIDSLHQRGIRAGLLLGEPRWMLPEFRSNLKELLNFFSQFSFDEIVYDLEPNQLSQPGYIDEPLDDSLALVRLWETLTEIQPYTFAPFSCTVHYRYLTQKIDNRTFGTLVQELSPHHINLMIYSGNPTTVTRRMQRLLSEFPTLPLSVSVSVEPSPIVGDNETYAQHSREEFHTLLKKIHTDLTQFPQFSGLWIQSMEFYQEMQK
ncbi:MAG: hypothetical protein ACQEQ4_04270 [Fibrobacterota bacterium]